MVRITKNGQPIQSEDDWFRLAPPEKGGYHWKDGRSAKELARRWLEGFPPEVAEVLRLEPRLRNLQVEVAEPEHRTKLDEFYRERSHDLLLTGTAEGGRVTVGIEGKADETFGNSLNSELRSRPRSNRPERIRRIRQGLFHHPDDPSQLDLRYQLLHAMAGTLIEARQQSAALAVLLIHEFLTGATNPAKAAQNAHDLSRFLSALGASPVVTCGSGFLAGPVSVPGYMSIPPHHAVFVAKATVTLPI